jgi:hypothetical protein
VVVEEEERLYLQLETREMEEEEEKRRLLTPNIVFSPPCRWIPTRSGFHRLLVIPLTIIIPAMPELVPSHPERRGWPSST